MEKGGAIAGRASVRAKEYALLVTPEGMVMTSVSGKTKNGFTYEGDYERANSDRVTWTATYRQSGHFYGMRHGRVDQLMGVSISDVDDAVKDDIEATWTQAR
jgi:hypothetical protein